MPRLEFRGEFLHTFLDTERVISNKPVTLIRGADQFTGDTLDYDNLSGVANLNGRVRGLLMPSAAMTAAPGKKR
jgi:lipopolysaccharide export system protein LptC